jgi:hypothetical protein
MRKRFYIVLAFVGVAIVGWLACKALRSPEPSYQGRRLSEWLDEYNRAGDMGKTEPISEAIRAMGTNTLPFLLANIKHTDSPLARKFFYLFRKQDLVKLPFYGAYPYRVPSIMALSALGSNAAPLCPELSKVAEDARLCILGTSSLRAIGPSSIPTLTKLCHGTNEFARSLAVLTIAAMKGDSGLFWSWLKAPVNDRPMLGLPGFNFNIVAKMVGLLDDPDPAIQRASADVIGHYAGPQFKQDTKSAVEPLVKAVNDPDPSVRLSAGKALKAIDPIAAARAGLK